MADADRPFRWPSPRRAFAGADLRYHSVVGVEQEPGDAPFDFSGAAFRGSLFRDCTFFTADFSRSDFSECDIVRTRFVDCAFRLFGFHTSRLRGVALVGARARDGAILQSFVEGSSFLQSDWSASNLHHNTFSECTFEEVSLDGASIHHNRFARCSFRRMDLTGPLLNYCLFEECAFEGVRLDFDALLSNAGWTMSDLRSIVIVRENVHLTPLEVAESLAEAIRVRRSRGELFEAANAAMLLDRLDILEELLEELPVLLREHPRVAASDQWSNLARNLLHWVRQGRLHPYWLGWVFRACVNHARVIGQEGGMPLQQLSDAAMLLAGPVQAYESEVARSVVDALPVRMDAPVELTLEAREDASIEEVLAWLDEADAEAASQVPPTLRKGGRVLRLRYLRHRRGSLFVDLQGWMLGAAILAGLLGHAGIALRAGRGVAQETAAFVEEGADAGARMVRAVRRGLVDATAPLERAESTSRDRVRIAPTPPRAPDPEPASIFDAKEGPSRALDLVSHRNTTVNTISGVTPSPPLRRKTIRFILSFKLHVTIGPTSDDPPP